MSKQYDKEELASDLEGGSERIRRSRSDRKRSKVVKHREREVRDRLKDITDVVEARILASEGAYFLVRTTDGLEYTARTVKSTVSGNPNATLAAVGDTVSIEVGDEDQAIIREVHLRKTKLARKAHKRKNEFEQVIAANIERLLITSSVVEPPFFSHIVDRYIVAGLEGKLDVHLIVNKIDLLSGEERDLLEQQLAHYDRLGYKVFRTSIKTGEGIDELRNSLRGITAVLAGRSGVGKSSIINALAGKALAHTRELTKKLKRGAHTTTSAVLLPLEIEDAYLVDTPGVREFFSYDPDAENLKFHYKEFVGIQDQCKMTNCMHIHEPGCAVIEAVDQGIIPEWRYSSYAMLFREASHS